MERCSQAYIVSIIRSKPLINYTIRNMRRATMTSSVKLTACIIVQNEESHLPYCLASIQSIADEIIVVDTGSTDTTKQLAEQYHAQVYDFQWNDNFADARNYALEQATGEWILYIDADERLEESGHAAIREAIEQEELLLLGLKVVNYYGHRPPQYERSNLLVQYRIFRRTKATFTGAIHEQLNLSVPLQAHQVKRLTSQLSHYGYLQERVLEKNKMNRNVNILLKEKARDKNNPWTDYFIANELNQLGEKVKAYEFVNLAITGFIAKQQLPPSLLYKLKYSIVIDLQQFEGIEQSIDLAIKIHPDFVDLYYYKGLIMKGQGKLDEAITAFDQALLIGENNLQHLTLCGTGSFLSKFEKAVCLEQQGMQTSALLLIEEVLAEYNNYAPALVARERIKALYTTS